MIRIGRRTVAATSASAALVAGLALSAPAAWADNATATAPFGSGRHIEARVWKDKGNLSPHWTTSAWAYHGSALWKVTWIKNTADLYSTGASITVSCSTDKKCTATGSLTGNHVSLWWQNGDSDESDLGGQMQVNGLVVATKACSSAVGYSQPLGLHSNVATACVGWG
ncbi:MAG TPA: hypothetical protein VI248_23825 [Kineosporiaceae bacterium]